MKRHFHWSYPLLLLKKTLLLTLLPLLQLAFRLEWQALLAVARQEVILLTTLSLLCLWIGQGCSYRTEGDCLVLRYGLIFSAETRIPAHRIAAVQVERTLFARLTGAGWLILYPAAVGGRQVRRLCLSRAEAERLADWLLPAAVEEAEVYHPQRGHRLVLALLSANGITTLTMLVLALRRSRSFGDLADRLTRRQLFQTYAIVHKWVPAGLAWLLTLICFLTLLSFARGLFHTLRYRVWKTGRLLCCESGIFHIRQLRLRRECITAADVRLTVLARALRCYPLHLTVGSCVTEEIPFLLYRPGQEGELTALLPGFRLPPAERMSPDGRSRFLLLPGAAGLGLCGLFLLLAAAALPELVAVLLVPLLYFGAMTLCAAEALTAEGAWVCDGQLTLRRQRYFTLHCICILAPDPVLSVRQTPWAAAADRCDLRPALPGQAHFPFAVRSIPFAQAQGCINTMQLKQR